MAKPVRKREADTVAIQQLWAAVEFIRKQRQVANIERICRFTQRSFGLKDSQVDLHLVQAVHDGMISAYKAVGFKGSRTGMEQEGYKIPDIEDFERGSHDWYCFDCHQAGEVVECDGCWRVYHPTCTEEDWTGPKFICSVCKNVQPNPGNMKKREVSNLMKYVCNRLKDKTKQLHNLKARDEVGEMHVSRLLYTYMDLNTMEAKAQANKYPNMEQFFADARTLLHNTFILFGDAGEVAQLARIMIRDCKYDLDEIRQCKDCYYYSNAKPKDWFCQPCRPAHRLVFAKQKGFSFWPAKVIKSTREGNDVRFFGSYHQRAIIEERSCKPIDSTLKALRIKRTPGFGRANAELLKHQALLAKMTSDSPRPISGNDDSEDEMEDQEKTPPRKVTTSPGGAEDSITETATPRTIKRPHHADDEGYAPVVVPTRNPRRSVREDDESYEESESPPRKMRKLNRDENIVSSSNLVSHKAASTPEDTNLVTSSEDMPGQPRVVSTADVASQTHKKLLHGKQCQKAVQVELQPAVVSCTCEDKYNAMLTSKTESLQAEHKEDKEKALKELEDRLRADFEDDKQQAVARAMSNIQRESERVQRQTETRCKEQYMEEMKKLAQKHKTEISTTKKKQWCYNCEEEAMYHCCWNTSYCSVKCQQEHWHKEHKRMCRRKRT